MESDHTCPLAYYPVISPAGDKQIFAVVKLRITDGHLLPISLTGNRQLLCNEDNPALFFVGYLHVFS
jgi:hypothetical protein